MQQELKKINLELKEKLVAISKKADFLQKIEKRIGKIRRANELTDLEIEKFFSGKPLAGVDGSIYTHGANFPYNITFFKALAKNTTGGTVELNKIFTPLQESSFLKLEQLALENRVSLEAAYSRLKEETLAALEIEAAIQIVKNCQPRIILLDGGFLRYGSLAAEKWQEFKNTAFQYDCIPVGVIEEIGTFEIRKILQDELPVSVRNSYDRELLFGLFIPGQWLEVNTDLVMKRGYYTCFGRLALNPQATAWDFFEEQKEYAARVIDYLYTITPRQSRGIPFWLDVVDREVRLTKNTVEMLLLSSLDAELLELFFKSSREKRNF